MGNPIIWFGDALKAFKNKLFFNNDISIQGGALNPTVTAVDAEPGSQYNSSLTSGVYIKQDSGSSTNWALLDDTSNEIPSGGTTGQALIKDSNDNYDVEWGTPLTNGAIGITINSPVVGIAGSITIPYDCAIQDWTLTADIAGDIVIDVKKSTYASFPTTASIAGSEKPTLSGVQKNQDLTLSTWTTTVTAGDVIEFVVDSFATVTKVTLVLKVIKS